MSAHGNWDRPGPLGSLRRYECKPTTPIAPPEHQYKVGDVVIHTHFGSGTVVRRGPGSIVTVRFQDDESERLLMVGKAPMQRVPSAGEAEAAEAVANALTVIGQWSLDGYSRMPACALKATGRCRGRTFDCDCRVCFSTAYYAAASRDSCDSALDCDRFKWTYMCIKGQASARHVLMVTARALERGLISPVEGRLGVTAVGTGPSFDLAGCTQAMIEHAPTVARLDELCLRGLELDEAWRPFSEEVLGRLSASIDRPRITTAFLAGGDWQVEHFRGSQVILLAWVLAHIRDVGSLAKTWSILMRHLSAPCTILVSDMKNRPFMRDLEALVAATPGCAIVDKSDDSTVPCEVVPDSPDWITVRPWDMLRSVAYIISKT
jgi:hypothetical protein